MSAPKGARPGCSIDGPLRLLTKAVKQVRCGMTRAEVERLLGPSTYSPIEGQHYYFTGGECPMNDGNGGPPTAGCGVVAEFRACRSKECRGTILTGCWWGAIGE